MKRPGFNAVRVKTYKEDVVISLVESPHTATEDVACSAAFVPVAECRRKDRNDIREAAGWLVDRLREDVRGATNAEGSIREALGPNGETLLAASGAAQLVSELKALTFISYSTCSDRYQELIEELAQARHELDIERRLVALIEILDARLSSVD